MMLQFFQNFLDYLFGRDKLPPEGVQVMHQAMSELQESTDELRQKLDEHRDEYVIVGAEPIRDHIVPDYIRRR